MYKIEGVIPTEFYTDFMLADKAIIGYRAWDILDNFRITPIGVRGGNWSYSPTEEIYRADCYQDHRAPFLNCHCGFNSFYPIGEEKADQLYRDHMTRDRIWGTVAGAGETQLHRGGFRSEQLQILAFYIPNYLSDKKQKSYRGIAEIYGVPFFATYEELMEYSQVGKQVAAIEESALAIQAQFRVPLKEDLLDRLGREQNTYRNTLGFPLVLPEVQEKWEDLDKRDQKRFNNLHRARISRYVANSAALIAVSLLLWMLVISTALSFDPSLFISLSVLAAAIAFCGSVSNVLFSRNAEN